MTDRKYRRERFIIFWSSKFLYRDSCGMYKKSSSQENYESFFFVCKLWIYLWEKTTNINCTSVKTRDSSGIYGRGMGGLQLLKWTSSLFTKLALCSQNVSVDWWKCLTLRWSSHRIPLTALHGAASGPYTNKHLIFRPRAIIPSMSLSVKDITRQKFLRLENLTKSNGYCQRRSKLLLPGIEAK